MYSHISMISHAMSFSLMALVVCERMRGCVEPSFGSCLFGQVRSQSGACGILKLKLQPRIFFEDFRSHTHNC